MMSVREGMSGPKAFVRPIAKLNREFDSVDYAMGLPRIQSFAVPAGTLLKASL